MSIPTIFHRRIAYSIAHDELLSLYDDQQRLVDKMQARGAKSDADDRAIMNALMEIIERLDAEHSRLYREMEN